MEREAAAPRFAHRKVFGDHSRIEVRPHLASGAGVEVTGATDAAHAKILFNRIGLAFEIAAEDFGENVESGDERLCADMMSAVVWSDSGPYLRHDGTGIYFLRGKMNSGADALVFSIDERPKISPGAAIMGRETEVEVDDAALVVFQKKRPHNA